MSPVQRQSEPSGAGGAREHLPVYPGGIQVGGVYLSSIYLSSIYLSIFLAG